MLFFAAPLVESVSDFSAGETPVLLPVAGHRISTSICYEIVYPNPVRQFVADGSELLTAITNDAWFGPTSAPYQHFAMASMRAIEEGRIWCGPRIPASAASSIPYGHVLDRSPRSYQPAVLVGDARYLQDDDRSTRGIGDVVAYASVVICPLAMLLARARRLDSTISQTPEEHHMPTDDLMHRYEDLSRRAFRSSELSLKPHARRRTSPPRGARRRARFLEGSGRRAEGAAAPPPPRAGSRPHSCRSRSESDDLAVLVEWAEAGEAVDAELRQALDTLDQEVQAGEIKKMLGGEHDRKNAIVTIHPGAGGTESQDWAEMLLRMYLRWTERRGFKREIIDYQPGDEAGLKSATLTLPASTPTGCCRPKPASTGWCASPRSIRRRGGTPRSPRCYVWPELPEDVDIEIDDKDLRIDTYRSSGAGGQHVNVTDSAVRLTHLPTGIVVSCQNERSQHRNRDSAMKVLKARLYDLKMKEKPGEARADQRRQEGHRVRPPDSQLRAAPVPDGQGSPHQGAGRRPRPRARRRHRCVHQELSDEEVERYARRGRRPTRMLTERRRRPVRVTSRSASSSRPASCAAADRPRPAAGLRALLRPRPTQPTRSAPRSAFPTSCRTCSAKARCRRRSFRSTRRSSRAASGARPIASPARSASLLALAVRAIVLVGVLATPLLIDAHRARFHRREARADDSSSSGSCFLAPDCWCCRPGASASSTAIAASCCPTPRRSCGTRR